MSENRKQLAKAAVVSALLLVGVLLAVKQWGPEDGASVYGVQSQYSKTGLELHYALLPEAVGSSPFPVTMTCQLRRGGGEGVLAQQVLTWTVPCVDVYAADPVVEPITLTWTLSEPLTVGWYEEWCKSEAAGVYGWLDGASSQQDNFFLVNHWEEVGLRCYLPLVIKAGR